MATFRKIKQDLLQALQADDWEEQIKQFADLQPKKLLNPLLGFVHHEGALRWRSLAMMGPLVSRIADARMEDGRVIMRRLMWNLNEESGALGWGSPEAMGAILASHHGLAKEFHRILASYTFDPEGCEANFIDHAPLRRGAYWGLGRLAEVYPDLAINGLPGLLLALDLQRTGEDRNDPTARGYVAWALGLLGRRGGADALEALQKLSQDTETLELFRNRRIETISVGALACEGLAGV